MFQKKIFIQRTIDPIPYLKIKYPKKIPKDKKIIGYNIYYYKHPVICCFLPLCLKMKYTVLQKPIYV